MAKGIVHPNGHIIKGGNGPDSIAVLDGERITRPIFAGQVVGEVAIDSCFSGKHGVDMSNDLIKRIIEQI